MVILELTLSGTLAMADPEDISMMLMRATKSEVVSAEIAVRFAEMVFTHVYGEAVVRPQLPLIVGDRGDRWAIRGSSLTPSSPDLADPAGGRLVITIMKADGRIVELVREIMPRP